MPQCQQVLLPAQVTVIDEAAGPTVAGRAAWQQLSIIERNLHIVTPSPLLTLITLSTCCQEQSLTPSHNLHRQPLLAWYSSNTGYRVNSVYFCLFPFYTGLQLNHGQRFPVPAVSSQQLQQGYYASFCLVNELIDSFGCTAVKCQR